MSTYLKFEEDFDDYSYRIYGDTLPHKGSVVGDVSLVRNSANLQNSVGGNMYFFGEALNGTNAILDELVIEAYLYNEDDGLIKSRGILLTKIRLYPEETIAFPILFSNVRAEDVIRYEVVFADYTVREIIENVPTSARNSVGWGEIKDSMKGEGMCDKEKGDGNDAEEWIKQEEEKKFLDTKNMFNPSQNTGFSLITTQKEGAMPKKPMNPEIHAAILLASLLKALEKDIQGLPLKLEGSLSRVDENDLTSALVIVRKIQNPGKDPNESFLRKVVKEYLSGGFHNSLLWKKGEILIQYIIFPSL